MVAPAISKDYFHQMSGRVILGPMGPVPMAAPPPPAAAPSQPAKRKGNGKGSKGNSKSRKTEPRTCQKNSRKMALQRTRAVQLDHLLDMPQMSRREANDNTLQGEQGDVPGAQTHLCPSSCQWGWISCEGRGEDSGQREEPVFGCTKQEAETSRRFRGARSRSQRITCAGKK